MSIVKIYNYLKVNDQIITGGQPTEEQIRAAAAEGYTTVINLATFDPHYSLKDEASLVKSLGMRYYPIPVDWESPKESDFEAFEQTMKQIPVEKTLIHCAANFRATAFYGLYGLKNLGWTAAQMETFRGQIWKESHYPVWEKFIAKMKRKIHPKEQVDHAERPTRRRGRTSR
jgi:protein tyrosine phosphatase (PTP) superfamily phosphohydrolase (DUF442 family)